MIGYIRQAWLVLALALGFGVALAGVNSALKPIIDKNEAQAKAVAAVKVVPGAAKAVKMEQVPAFRVLDADGRLVGWAAPVEGNGYADVIRMVVGLTPDATRLTGLEVLFNNETPGLGNEIVSETFRGQFTATRGLRSYERIKAAKTDSPDNLKGQEIQALSGATVSSQAVCDIILEDLAASGLIYELNKLYQDEFKNQEGASDGR